MAESFSKGQVIQSNSTFWLCGFLTTQKNSRCLKSLSNTSEERMTRVYYEPMKHQNILQQSMGHARTSRIRKTRKVLYRSSCVVKNFGTTATFARLPSSATMETTKKELKKTSRGWGRGLFKMPRVIQSPLATQLHGRDSSIVFLFLSFLALRCMNFE